MSLRNFTLSRWCSCFALTLLSMSVGGAQQIESKAGAALGSQPPSSVFPRAEFAFEFRVTLSPAVVLGDTPFGHRQYIPITGGKIAGPKFSGEVLPGGWDYQLGLSDGCNQLSADYFIRAQDGAVIHVLNEGVFCRPNGANSARSFFRPRFEAPKGPHEWLTRATFVAALEVEPPAPAGSGSAPQGLNAIRLKFYQIQ
jgi:Protein of unknown function (DUF3237)